MKFVGHLAVVLFLSLAGAAQDPTKAAPDSCKLRLENEYVKVLYVTYAPKAKVPVHDHSRFPAAYIYLSDSGPIRFIHSHWDDPVLTRPATRAGSFRLSPTRFEDETHEVENNGDLASHFLRIEIKTEAPDRKSLNGRFKPFEGDRTSGLNKIEFENSQLRVTRIISRPGERLEFSALAGQPSLIVVIAAPWLIIRRGTPPGSRPVSPEVSETHVESKFYDSISKRARRNRRTVCQSVNERVGGDFFLNTD